jgi:hypothetical protein
MEVTATAIAEQLSMAKDGRVVNLGPVREFIAHGLPESRNDRLDALALGYSGPMPGMFMAGYRCGYEREKAFWEAMMASLGELAVNVETVAPHKALAAGCQCATCTDYREFAKRRHQPKALAIAPERSRRLVTASFQMPHEIRSDAVPTGLRYDPETRTVSVRFEHPSFPAVAEGMPVPVIEDYRIIRPIGDAEARERKAWRFPAVHLHACGMLACGMTPRPDTFVTGNLKLVTCPACIDAHKNQEGRLDPKPTFDDFYFVSGQALMECVRKEYTQEERASNVLPAGPVTEAANAAMASQAPACECGGAKTSGTHSSWCPMAAR